MKIFPKFFSTSECVELLRLSESFQEKHDRLNNRDIYYKVVDDYTQLNTLKSHLKGVGIVNNPPFNITCYKKGSFFLPHIDRGSPNDVKSERISTFIIQLSNTDDYKGGDLIVDNQVIPRDIGTAVQFDGYTLHELQEVTEGIRYSAVFWLKRGNIEGLRSII